MFVCEVWLFDLFYFLNSADLICQDTDISKYFKESCGLRDNESRQYIKLHTENSESNFAKCVREIPRLKA